MTFEVSPDEIRNAEFRTTLRGLDKTEVTSMLAAAAARIEQLEAECRKLEAKAEEKPSSDLESEFETIGREVAAILQSAREAAEAMRSRASLDAARWRSEAMEEADTTRKDAAADAEALRRDAWVTGSELLQQAQTNAEAMRANAERDVLTIMGEAEREAHRLTSGARRDAEDVVRNANMEAEKVTSDATKRRDEIIDGANRQAAAAQERTRALEHRRDELLEELENVRSTLTRLEGSLDERREALDLTASSEPSNVRVVHPPAEAKRNWELGETVRVVPPEGRDKPEPDTSIAEEVSDQVARIQERQPDPGLGPDPRLMAEAAPEPEPEPTPEPVPVAEATPAAETEPVAEAEEADTPSAEPDEDLEALFASLRGTGDESEPVASEADDMAEAEPNKAPDEDPADRDDSDDDDGTDWLAVRDSRLLPITNRALRGVKKAMTEVQNVALDSLRTEDDWQPDESAIAEAVHAELVAVWSESFAAGHAIAEEMTGDRLKRPSTPSSKADLEFASDLANAVTNALHGAGDGPRERQSAASRVFRVWRSDEAERRIRDVAVLGYETGIERSRRVTAG